jgi:hypothetical protein
MLRADSQYCIFTTREQSKYVFAVDNPYSGKLLNESVNTVSDVKFLQENPVQFKFDGVYDETSSGKQDKIFVQNVRPMVHSFVEGTNQCVILFGPTACGKTYTLKGGQGSDRGIVPRAIEETLNLIKNNGIDESQLDKTPNFQNQKQKILLKLSIYMIYMEKVFDLLDKNNRQNPQIEHFMDQ